MHAVVETAQSYSKGQVSLPGVDLCSNSFDVFCILRSMTLNLYLAPYDNLKLKCNTFC